MAADNNSLRRSDGRPTAEERRKDLQVFEGVRVVRKKDNGSFWNWLATMFFSGRSLKSIVKEVVKNEVVPSAQDGVYNSAVSFIGKLIYKEDQKRGASNGSYTPSSSFVNYVSYGDKGKSQSTALEENQKKEAEIIKNGFDNPAFVNLEEATKFLASMHAYASKYDDMSVQDLAWMRKKMVDYTWDKWGWSSEEILAIKAPTRFTQPVIVDDGNGRKIKLTHFIDLPKAHEL